MACCHLFHAGKDGKLGKKLVVKEGLTWNRIALIGERDVEE